MDATTIAVDLAKPVFEVAIADRQWHIVARHRFNRRPFALFLTTVSPTHIVMEACGTAHYWGRVAQEHGHRVTLLPPAYVRPYVRRNKTDRTDAEALLEATRSGQMPSVPVKSVAQQALVALHRIREQWMATRTARINALRGILREQGVLLPAGAGPALSAIQALLEDAENALQPRSAGRSRVSMRRCASWKPVSARSSGSCVRWPTLIRIATRLREIPGIGLLTATALVGTVGHIHAFHRARQFAS
jgi:transposase